MALALEIVTDQALWQSAGVTNLNGSVADGSVRWFLKDTEALSASVTADNGWHRVPINGGRLLTLQYSGTILDIEGVTGAVSSANLSLVALGLPYDESVVNGIKHPLLLRAPSDAGVSPAAAAERDFCLLGRPFTSAQIYAGSNALITLDSHAAAAHLRSLVAVGTTPADNTAVAWGMEIGRPALVSTGLAVGSFTPGANNTGFYTLNVEGLDAVFLSIASFVDWATAAPTTFKTKAVLRAVVHADVSLAKARNFKRPIA